MAANPILSICIPTFNRAGLLSDAIESILAQAGSLPAGSIEIVISDNASTDETEAVVQKLCLGAKLTVKYYKHDKNEGFDRNCLRVVERASGRFAWILGDDDLLAAGALIYVLDKLNERVVADLYFGEKEDFYLTPDRPMRFRRIMNLNNEATFDFHRVKMVDDYFRCNKKLIAYCNFLSNIVFCRAKWLKVEAKENFIGTAYIHVYIFQSMLWGRAPGVMRYLPRPLVRRRWGNDGPLGPEDRLNQDVKMFRRIAEAVFVDKKYVRAIDDLVIRNDGFSWAVRVKLDDPKRFAFSTLPFLFRAYWDHALFWLKLVPLACLPNFLLRFLRDFYRRQVKGEPLTIRQRREDEP